MKANFNLLVIFYFTIFDLLSFFKLLPNCYSSCSFEGRYYRSCSIYNKLIYSKLSMDKCLVRKSVIVLENLIFDNSSEIYDFSYMNNKLIILTIKDTNLETIVNISSLKYLFKFSMNKNQLNQLKNNTVLPRNLKIIDFSSNRIELIDNFFFLKFQTLFQIYLQNNLIKTIDNLIFKSKIFYFIDLKENLITNASFQFDVNPLEKTKIILESNHLDILPVFNGKIRTIHQLNLRNQKSTNFLISIEENLNFAQLNLTIEEVILDNKILISNFLCILNSGSIEADKITLINVIETDLKKDKCFGNSEVINVTNVTNLTNVTSRINAKYTTLTTTEQFRIIFILFYVIIMIIVVIKK